MTKPGRLASRSALKQVLSPVTPRETDSLERVADRGALLRELRRIAGDAGLLHRLLEQIDDVVGLRVGVVRDLLRRSGRASGVLLALNFLVKARVASLRSHQKPATMIMPSASRPNSSIEFGSAKICEPMTRPGEALAAQFLDDLAGAVGRAGDGDHVGLALERLGDLRRDIEALELDGDRLAERHVVGLEDRRIELACPRCWRRARPRHR